MPRVTVTVDGARYTDDVPARTLLVHYLRDQLGKIGTVVGCDTGNCGACTVHLTDPDGVPRAVKSCSVLAVQADGAQVSTVESLGGDHPVQRAFHEQHALQCGFCTPGMMMAAVDLLRENADPTDAEIREGLEGNLCRCTGYQNIVRAVRMAAAEMRAEAETGPALAEPPGVPASAGSVEATAEAAAQASPAESAAGASVAAQASPAEATADAEVTA